MRRCWAGASARRILMYCVRGCGASARAAEVRLGAPFPSAALHCVTCRKLRDATHMRRERPRMDKNKSHAALTPTQLLDVVTQDISPDSSELLLASTQGVEVDNDSFWILPLPNGAPRRLPFTARSAAWSRDGQQLVVCKNSDLYIAKHDGTELHRLLSNLQTPSAARFSPDGTRIRFTQSDPAQATQSLWEVRADGRGLHTVLPGWYDAPRECCGKWTGDGRYYVFQSTNPSGTNIWVLLSKVNSSAEPRKGLFN